VVEVAVADVEVDVPEVSWPLGVTLACGVDTGAGCETVVDEHAARLRAAVVRTATAGTRV